MVTSMEIEKFNMFPKITQVGHSRTLVECRSYIPTFDYATVPQKGVVPKAVWLSQKTLQIFRSDPSHIPRG